MQIFFYRQLSNVKCKILFVKFVFKKKEFLEVTIIYYSILLKFVNSIRFRSKFFRFPLSCYVLIRSGLLVKNSDHDFRLDFFERLGLLTSCSRTSA